MKPNNQAQSIRQEVNLATLLDSHKILPHYERVSGEILHGGGGDSRISAAHCR